MKYILIIGTKDAGKSTTIDAVCKKLKPTSVERLNSEKVFEKVSNTVDILNGTYVIEVDGKIILVVAGAPTEQGITITVLIKICLKIKLKIDFALIAKRTTERKDGFDTKNELKNYGECILEERIWQVEGAEFRETQEWQKRINNICKLVRSNY